MVRVGVWRRRGLVGRQKSERQQGVKAAKGMEFAEALPNYLNLNSTTRNDTLLETLHSHSKLDVAHIQRRSIFELDPNSGIICTRPPTLPLTRLPTPLLGTPLALLHPLHNL